MDIGAEISKKIQMAITSKLKELDAYVDDELPDYIMIMVANKKTEAQMTEALSLFLSNNTKVFTSWLHNLLSSLRKGKGERKTSETLNKEEQHLKTRSKSIKKEWKAEDNEDTPLIPLDQTKPPSQYKVQSEAIISIDNDMNDIFNDELLAESSAAELISPLTHTKSELNSQQKLPVSTLTETQKVKSNKPMKELKRKSSDIVALTEASKAKKDRVESKTGAKSQDKHDHKVEKSSRRTTKQADPKKEKQVREWDRGKTTTIKSDNSNAKRKQVRHRDQDFLSDSDDETIDRKQSSGVASAVNQVIRESDFVSESDSDGDNSKSSVSSRISYPKRTMKIPLEKQANKALFMKAVNAAEKSVKSKVPKIQRDLPSEPVKATKMIRKLSSEKRRKNIVTDDFPENDARRKLQIKRAVGQALVSELVARKSHHTVEQKEGEKSHTVKDPKKHEKLQQVKKPRIQKSITPEHFQKDQRKFIIEKNIVDPSVPGTVIDSHEALPRQDEDAVTLSRKLQPSTTQEESEKAPSFIVTLDGVIRTKHLTQPTEEERKAARLEKFKFPKITVEAKQTIKTEAKPASAALQLQKMEEKILEVQKESTRLKEMQMKLAAVQAVKSNESNSSSNGLKSISVANVDYSTTEKQLCEHFSICGKVVRSTILRSNTTGHPKGFAYLEFEDERAVSSALALNNTQFNSRVIRVTLKQPTVASLPSSLSVSRGYYRGYRGRSTRAFPARYRKSRFSRYGVTKVIARNKTWINPAILELSK